MLNPEGMRLGYYFGTSVEIPDSDEWIIDKDTGIMGRPGKFVGERSVNGMPIHPQTLEEREREKRESIIDSE